MQAAQHSHSAPTSLKDWDRAFSCMCKKMQKPHTHTAKGNLRRLTDLVSRVNLLRKRIQGQNIELLDQAQEREFITDPKEKGLLYWSEQYAMLAEDHQLQNYQIKAMQFWVGMLDHLTGSSHLVNNTQKSFSRAEIYKQKLEKVIENQKAKMARLTVQQKEYEIALQHMNKRKKQIGSQIGPAPKKQENTLQLHKKSLQTKRDSMEELAIKSEAPIVAKKTRSINTLQQKKTTSRKSPPRLAHRPDIRQENKPAPSIESVLQNAKQLLQELDS